MARKSRSRAKRAIRVGALSNTHFSYYSFSFSSINKSYSGDGNKVIMPPSALSQLLSAPDEIKFPLNFKIINPKTENYSHCGVLEFSGEEGNVYLPDWMMENLALRDGQIVTIKYTELTQGTCMKIQPHSTEFVMNLSDPKSAMERIFNKFGCVTSGDTIMVNLEDKNYYIDIVQVEPDDAISLDNTYCQLDFATPLDYKEPELMKSNTKLEDDKKENKKSKNDTAFETFTGISYVLDDEDHEELLATQKNYNSDKSIMFSNSKKAVEKSSSHSDDDDCVADKNRGKTRELIEDGFEDNALVQKLKFQPFTGKKYILD